MDIVCAVRQQLDKYHMLDHADTLICALSGGADSVCLAHVLWQLASEWNLNFACAHFNHHLRGDESDRDEAFVKTWCRERRIPLYQGNGDVRSYAAEHRIGIEEAARNLRYAFLDSLGSETTRIATAHHADDVTETMLLNLLRGSGLKGLCGIPPIRGRYIRPLLPVTHKEILAYLSEHGLNHVEDSTNEEDDCTRNQLRHHILPLLREINPSISKACVRTGELLRQDEAYLEQQAQNLLRREGGTVVLSVEALLNLPDSISSRAIRQAASQFQVKLTRMQTDAVLNLCRSGPSKRTVLPDGLAAYRVYDELRFEKETETVTWAETILSFGQWAKPEGMGYSVFAGDISELANVHGKFTSWFFKKDKTCGMICLRKRLPGDTLRLPGRNCTKTLKKWMIELHIPERERNTLPVLADEAGVLAVPGIGIAERIAVSPKEADAVIIFCERT